MRLHSLIRIERSLFCCLSLILGFFVFAAPAAHAALGERGFSFGISEKEAVLANPTSISTKMREAWDTSSQRIMSRNMPYIEIANLDYSTGNLTALDITIGDTRFNFSDDYFGVYVRPGSDTPAGAIDSATTTDGDVLNILFGGDGLAPGESVIFQIDIGADTPNMFQQADFRTVLFDMNGLNVYDDVIDIDTADNSVFTATFADPLDTTMTGTAALTLEDYAVTGPQANYYNQNRRPYTEMEGVDIFSGLVDPPVVIPEPTSVALAGLSLCGLLYARRRRRLAA